MSSGVFLIQADGSLVRMDASRYDSEDLLQRLVAEYPDLLAGDQIDGASPRRWLLIRRELGIPDGPGSTLRWSVDHLFLDQDGVPTLVEVKRSSDTRIRREVVGQLIEYAANAVTYWPIELIRAELEARCAGNDSDPEEAIRTFLGETEEPEGFWKKVKTNLQAGRIRLIFLADEISSELERIVEFLNEQMDPAEVLALEIRQFTTRGQRVLVPRVMGQTASARARKRESASRATPWTAEEMLAKLRTSGHPEDAPRVGRIIQWAADRSLELRGGRGSKHATLDFGVHIHGEVAYPLNVYEGYTRAYLYFMPGNLPQDSPELRDRFARSSTTFPASRCRRGKRCRAFHSQASTSKTAGRS